MEVGALRTRISLDSAQFEQGMAGINRQLKALQHEQKAVTSSGTGFARGVDELRAKSDVLNRTLELQRAKVTELARRYEASRAATGENSRETQNAQIAYQRAVAEMNRTENALQGVTAEIQRQTNPWNVLSNRMNDVGTRLQTVGRGMTDFGKNMSMKVTAPILGLGGAALKVGMDFEAGMSKVQALTQGTAEQMAAMSAQAKHLGETTIFSATQAAEGMAFLGMAGFKTNDILAAMPGMLNLAAAGAIELGQAADIASNIMQGFGIAAKDAGHVSDVMARATSNANTDIIQMGEAMKYLAPAAKTLGWSVEESAAAVMAFGDAGIQGSLAGQAFASSLTRLAKDPTPKMQKALDRLNFSFFTAEGTMKSMPDIIAGLEKNMAGWTDQQKAAALTQIFGAEAFKHWAVLVDKGSDALAKNTKMLVEADGAAEQMAKTMTANAKGSVIELKSALEGIGIALSQHMIPVVTDMVKKGTELVRKFGELDDGAQKNIIKMGLFAAAIGPVALVAGSLTTAIGGVVRIGGSLLGLLGGTGGTGLLARIGLMGVTGGPVALAIAGVAALALGIGHFTKDSEKAVEANIEFAQSLSTQHTELSAAANNYKALRREANLTTQEFGELLDIREKMAKNPEAEALKRLEERYEELRTKSGLTNEKLDELISLNDIIIEKAPHTADAHTQQGNAIAGVNEKLDKYLETLRLSAEEEIKLEKMKWQEEKLNKQQELNEAVEKQRQIQSQINMLSEYQGMSKQELTTFLMNVTDKMASYLTTEEEMVELVEREELLRTLIEEGLGGTISHLQKQHSTQGEIIENLNVELQKGKEIDALYAEIQLKKIDINAAGQEGVDIAIKQLEEKRKEKTELEELIKKEGDKGGLLSEQYEILKKQIREHETVIKLLDKETGLSINITTEEEKRAAQIRHVNDVLTAQERHMQQINSGQKTTNKSIDDGKMKAQEMNKELSKDVSKNVKVDDKGTAKKVHDEAEKSATKKVTLNASWKNLTTGFVNLMANIKIPGFASGTSSAPGGLAWVGEEGFELAKYGNQWSVLNAGLANLKQGTQVFTHDESKRILNAVSNLPAYSMPQSMPSTPLQGNSGSQPISLTLKPAPVYLDGSLVGHVDFDLIEDGMGTRFTHKSIINGVSPK